MEAISIIGSSPETLVVKAIRIKFEGHSTREESMLRELVSTYDICHCFTSSSWGETGAHLPGFKPEGWQSGISCSPLVGTSTAGITAYRTTFNLDLPEGTDIQIALKLELNPSVNYRSLIYINGWQFGRFHSNEGPQDTFPVCFTLICIVLCTILSYSIISSLKEY